MAMPRPSSRIRPTISRFFAFALACGPWLVSPVAAAPTSAPAREQGLTEAQAVARALDNPDLQELRRGLVDDAIATGRQQTAWSNPSLSYTREQLLSGGPLGEDYLTLQQTFDISGRRGLRRKAASARAEAARHEARIDAADIVALTRHRYYELLHAQRRREALTSWRERLASYLAIVQKREEAGDAAAFDRLRLQREVSRIDTLIEREDATVAAAWLRLHGLLQPATAGAPAPSPPALSTALLPAPASGPADAPEAVTGAPEFGAARAQLRALSLDHRAASRGWVPNPFIGAGYKGVDLGGGARAHGFVVNVGVPIPILNRQQGGRDRAAAQTRAMSARNRLATTHARSEVAALATRATRLAATARTTEDTTAREDEALLRAAAAGYRGGEISITELVDAYRSSVEARLLVLDLSMDARRADIARRRRTEPVP